MASKPRYRAGLCTLLFASAALVLSACIHHAGPAIVAFTQQNKLFVRGDCPQDSDTCSPFKPIEADVYASEQYDHYRESGFVTLRPDMRLRIVAPHGAATYNVIDAGRGALSVEPDDTTAKPVSGSTAGALDGEDLLRALPRSVWLRLYFQLRRSTKEHTTVLLFAKTEARLNEASGALEEDPDGFCAAPHDDAHCLAFPETTAVTAEVKVHVRKRDVYVPISATVRDALVAYGDVDPEHVAPHLKVERLWEARLVPVRFEKKSQEILSLPVVAGDRITW